MAVKVPITLLLVILLNFLSANLAKSESLTPVVTLSQGQLQGVIETSRSGNDYFAFLGIPYAQPPRRFEPPEPALIPGWNGLRTATEHGSYCLQPPFLLPAPRNVPVSGSEDCLFLNVYTSTVKQDAKKPVIVWIHGGAFYFGWSHMFGAKYLLDEDVVLVTINYRLGVLGFLNVGHMEGTETRAAGNMGIKDQVLALKWVQDNVEHFGGDKSRVTIYGESAGSASVNYHMISPMSKGLFHRAVLASASVMSQWAFTRDPSDRANDLGEAMNCPTSTSNELVECLTQKDANELVKQTGHSLPDNWRLDPLGPFSPSVEIVRSGAPPTFLSEHPEQLVKAGKVAQVPAIFGFTKNEGILFHSGTILQSADFTKELNSNWNAIAPLTLGLDNIVPESQMELAIAEIREFYFGNKQISVETAQELEDMYSDREFVHSTRSVALEHAKRNPTYLYSFDYNDGQNIFGLKFQTPITLHADDLRYVFSGEVYASVGTELKEDDEKTAEFSKRFVKLLVDFATDGKPDGKIVGNVDWPAINQDEASGKAPVELFHFDSPTYLQVEDKRMAARMNFWDQLLGKYGSNGNANTQTDNSLHGEL